MRHANSVFSACGTTIFETMSRLAGQHGAVNLGQGFPEGLEPPSLIQALARAVQDGQHQYPPMPGLPALRQAIADHEHRTYGLPAQADWTMVTSGATEALAACLFALIEPGDEVVVLEPLYDSYLPIIRRAGGVPRPVRLQPPDWDLPRQELIDAMGPKTRLLLLNSPANPCGKVFDRGELDFIATLIRTHDLTAICDEVYEHLTYDGRPHIPLITLPGMTHHCVKIGSAGKIFSLTGWKVGWVVADPTILTPIVKAHQYLTFCTPPALQQAVAWGLDNAAEYMNALPAILAARRDRLGDGLRRIGFDTLPVQGSYFLSADFRPLGFDGDDDAFCRHITAQAGVAAIPISAFYPQDAPRHLARFCFAKTDQAIDLALSRLKQFFLG